MRRAAADLGIEADGRGFEALAELGSAGGDGADSDVAIVRSALAHLGELDREIAD